MVFSSIIFILFFLPIFLAAYYSVPRKARNYIVLLFSIIFLAWGAPDFLPFMLGSCLANYYLVKLLGNTPQRNTQRLLVGLSVDVYRGKHEALKSPLDYQLYIMMFPHLLAGPIIRFEFIANQIRQREDSWSNILYGFYRFILGLSKKVLIADVLALEVDRILGLNIPGRALQLIHCRDLLPH